MEKLNTNQSELIASFYSSHRESLLRYVFSRLGNKEESEDLVQDVFVKLMQFDQFIKEETIESLTFTIASNKIKDILRHRICHRQMEDYTLYTSDIKYNQVERVCEYHETLRILNNGMEKLTKKCATVYKMSLFDGLTAQEIANRLNVSKRTIESQLFNSRKHVREYIRKEA